MDEHWLQFLNGSLCYPNTLVIDQKHCYNEPNDFEMRSKLTLILDQIYFHVDAHKRSLFCICMRVCNLADDSIDPVSRLGHSVSIGFYSFTSHSTFNSTNFLYL